MEHNNFAPGGTGPPHGMPTPASQIPAQQGHFQRYPGPPLMHPEGQGPHGHHGQFTLNQPPGLSSSSGHHDDMSYYSSYHNFSMPPPTFQPLPGFPPPPAPPFMPQNTPPPYPTAPYDVTPTRGYGPSHGPSHGQGDWEIPDNTPTSRNVSEMNENQRQRNGHDATESTQAKDEAWLSNWLQKTGAVYRLKREPSSSCISIPEASSKLRRALHLLEKLQDERGALKENDSDLTDQQLHIQAILSELAEIKRTFLSGETVDCLVKKLDRAGKKRRRCRRQQREAIKQKAEQEERKEALHKAIDEKMAAAAQELLDKKKALEVKAAADSTLAEVRRKIHEATKAADLISALTKLRSLRKDGAQRKGVYVPQEADECYRSKAGEMEKLLKQQLDVYDREKKALEVMLEQEQEEDKEKEMEIKRLKHHQEIKKRQKAIETWLFGPKVNVHPEDPLYRFKQYYEAGESNINNLLKIRHEWDAYLVPVNSMEGSPVPFGWVQPVAPSSAGWETFLVKSEPSAS